MAFAIIAEGALCCDKYIRAKYYIKARGDIEARDIFGGEIKVKGSIRVKGKLISQKYIEAGKDIEGRYIESGRGYNIIAGGKIICERLKGRIWQGTLVPKRLTTK